MKEEMLETTIWKLEVTLYKTGTVHLSLTNKINNSIQTFLIRKGKIQKDKSDKVYIS